MADLSSLPFRSTPFTGSTSLVQPVIDSQIFHATDTGSLYIANSLTQGDISPYGGGGGGASIPGFMVNSCKAPYYHTRDYGDEQSHRHGGFGIRFLDNQTYTLNFKPVSKFKEELPTPAESTAQGQNPAQVIEVYRWAFPPSSVDTLGKELVGSLSATGGPLSVEITDTYRWITVSARDFNDGPSAIIQNDYPNKDSKNLEPVVLQWYNTNDVWLWTFRFNYDLSPEVNANRQIDWYQRELL